MRLQQNTATCLTRGDNKSQPRGYIGSRADPPNLAPPGSMSAYCAVHVLRVDYYYYYYYASLATKGSFDTTETEIKQNLFQASPLPVLVSECVTLPKECLPLRLHAGNGTY